MAVDQINTSSFYTGSIPHIWRGKLNYSKIHSKVQKFEDDHACNFGGEGSRLVPSIRSHVVYRLRLPLAPIQIPLETEINHHNGSALYHTPGIASHQLSYFDHTNEQFPLADFMMVTPI